MKIGSQKTREPKQAFSNGTEFYGWLDNWCERCIHDKAARQGRYEDACAILTLAICGEGTPIEWLDGPRDEHDRYSLADRYHCIEFRDENEGPPPRTEPLPTPPGQGELIPMEPFVGTRMFSDVTDEAKSVTT